MLECYFFGMPYMPRISMNLHASDRAEGFSESAGVARSPPIAL